MAHQRDTIVQAVVALLIAAGTAAGSRVTSTRLEPHKKSGLPAISVYALSDQVDEENSSEMEVGHELALEITGWVAHTDATPSNVAMNNLADQIEVAIRANPYLGGTVSDIALRGPATVLEVVQDDAQSDPLVGIFVLTYAVSYHIALAAT